MKQLKSVLAAVLALIFALSLAACGTPTQSPTADALTTATPTAPTAAAQTAEPAKPVLLVVSFGTSYNDSRDITIGAIENALQAAYPDYEVRRAFTSQIIIDKLKERDGLKIDNVPEAMDRLVADGVKDVVIQPTHVMSGYEYDDVIADVTPYKDKFNSFKIGEPLLISDADYDQAVSAITAETAGYDADGTAIVFMGHGTEHEANAAYAKLQQKLIDAGHSNYFVGTVEAEPAVDDVLALVQAAGATKVVLLPFMIVAGDHANNDMAGDEEDSWKSVFEAAGFEVECLIQGLGQYPAIQQMFVGHVADAIAQPIYADQIADGAYAIEVSSSSSMFRVVDAQLKVENGSMTCVMTMSGKGYGKLYMGTGEAALADTEEHYIPSVITEDGSVTFEVPVEALNMNIDCAAWSIKKESWYDRVLVFEPGLIPADAITAG